MPVQYRYNATTTKWEPVSGPPGPAGTAPANVVTTDGAQTVTGAKTFTGGLNSTTTVADGSSPPSAYPVGISTISLPSTRTAHPNWPVAGSVGIVTTWRGAEVKHTYQQLIAGGYSQFRQASETNDTWGQWYVLLDGFPFRSKGRIAVGLSTTASDGIPGSLVVGTDGHVLTADSTTSQGIKWAAAPAAAAPANMVTTDTVQFITAEKLMRPAANPGVGAFTNSPDLVFAPRFGDNSEIFIRLNGRVSSAAGLNPTLHCNQRFAAVGVYDQAAVGTIDVVNERVYSLLNKVPVAGLSATGSPSATTFLRGDNTWAAPVAAAPANMVTTDTTQSITGAKTFTVTPVVPDSSFGVAKLSATGTKDATTFLRGDNTFAVPTAAAPANMVTTDTAQSITGNKTFQPGTLLMQNGTGVTAEPYSDANAPQTLERTMIAAPTNNPPAGESYEYTTDGKSLDMRAPDGTVTRIGPTAGGSGDVTLGTAQTFATSGVKTFPPGTLLMRNVANTESHEPYSDSNPPESLLMSERTTAPPTPTSGVQLFVRSDKARRVLSQVGPSGVDTSFQPALFSNRVGVLTASMGVAAVQQLGLVTTQAVTPALQAFATTNFYTRLARTRYATAATAGTGGGGPRTTTAQYFLSSLANLGGFFYVARFGIGAALPGSRGLIGMCQSVAAQPSVDPTTLLNVIAFGWDAADTNMKVVHRGSGAGTVVDLGASFPTKVSTTDFYECRLFAASGVTNSVSWAITRLNTGATASGVITTALPAADVVMGAHCAAGTSVATATSLDVQSLYIETDN